MEMPFNEVCDKYTISILKQQNIGGENFDKQVEAYKSEIDKRVTLLGNVDFIKFQIYLEELLHANSRIWKAEADIRKSTDSSMDMEDVGKRSIICRELNKLRIEYKNRLADMFNESQFKDVKKDHGSEDSTQKEE